MMTTTIKALMTHVAPSGPAAGTIKDKISVIGAGTVGAAVAFTLITQRVARELVLIDRDGPMAKSEILDIQNALLLVDNPTISWSTDFESSANSKIVILTAGCGKISGDDDTGDEHVRTRNIELFKTIVPTVVKYSPNCVLLVVTNPVDIMTYVAWKLSGFPPHRVLGTGTILQTVRFRYLLAHRLGVSPKAVHSDIIGQTGPNSIPVWSGVTVSGVRLRDVNTQLGTVHDPEDWTELYRQVIDSEAEVLKLKSFGSWGIALCVIKIVNAILHDAKECYPVSTHIKGCRHGVDKDVFLSLPCVLGSNGVVFIVRQGLNEEEKDQIQKSADEMYEIQKTLNLQTDEK